MIKTIFTLSFCVYTTINDQFTGTMKRFLCRGAFTATAYACLCPTSQRNSAAVFQTMSNKKGMNSFDELCGYLNFVDK
ncbi:hypothetical protein ACDQ55_08225 [Chitinophaga sp. 30R24]